MTHIKIYEEDIENYLSNPKNLKSKLNLEFIARQVEIPPLGRIDILAYHKPSKSFVIVEIKRGLLKQEALLQGLRYKNYYQTTYDKRCHDFPRSIRYKKFSLLLIGDNLDDTLHEIVKHYDDCNLCHQEIYYTLFDKKFGQEHNFNHYNIYQQDIEAKLYQVSENRYIKLSESCMKYYMSM